MSPGYSAVQTARLVSALRWVCGRLAEILGAWAAEAAEGSGPGEDGPAAGIAGAAVEMTVLSRRLASHRDVLDGLQPDSERLRGWRQAAPGDPSLAGALDQVAALQGALERLAVARQVLVPQLLDAYRDIEEQAAPHCDAALASVARSHLYDLDSLPDAGADRAVGGASAAVAEARGALAGAGGLVASSLLRPPSNS